MGIGETGGAEEDANIATNTETCIQLLSETVAQ